MPQRPDPFAAERAAHTAERVAAWRRQHPEATCGDATAALLAELEGKYGAFRVHVFVSVAPARCERCGGVWPDIDAALKVRCEVRRAA